MGMICSLLISKTCLKNYTFHHILQFFRQVFEISSEQIIPIFNRVLKNHDENVPQSRLLDKFIPFWNNIAIYMIFSPRMLFTTTEISSFANIQFIIFLDQISTKGRLWNTLHITNFQYMCIFVQTNRYSSQKMSQNSQVFHWISMECAL